MMDELYEINAKEDEEEERLWKDVYDKAIKEDADDGLLKLPTSDDKRKYPRLTLQKGKTVWVNLGKASAPIHNISAGGVCFQSQLELFPGDEIVLELGSLSVKSIVLDCTLEESDPTFLEYSYLVRTRYHKDYNGYRIYVLARDIYSYNLNTEMWN